MSARLLARLRPVRLAAARRPFSTQPAARAASAAKLIAQPLAATHPHLMADGETTPGVSSAEYAARREEFASLLPHGALALFSSAAVGYMSHDVAQPFFQDADLFYLSGFQEQSSLLACVKPRSEGSAARWHLFVRPSCAAEELWDGARAGVDGAQEHIIADGAAHSVADAASVLRAEVEGGAVGALLWDGGGHQHDAQLESQLEPLLKACAGAGIARASPRRLLHSLRVRKSVAERALLRRSGELCAGAFRQVRVTAM